MTQTKYRFLEVDEDGKQCHRHQYDGVDMTGGSTIVDVLGKTLTYWASGLAVKEFSGIEDCKVLTKIKNGKATDEEFLTTTHTLSNWLKSHQDIGVEEYLKICQKAYTAHATRLDDTAKVGTDMHQDLENYVKDCIENHEGKPYIKDGDFIKINQVEDFSRWAVINVKKFIASEAHCFDEVLFVGGITDAVCEMQDESLAIIDFKSAKVAYFSHFVQIAIYNILIAKNGLVDKKGVEIMKLEKPITQYIVFPFGMKELEPTIIKNTEGLIKSALACVELYRQKSAFENI